MGRSLLSKKFGNHVFSISEFLMTVMSFPHCEGIFLDSPIPKIAGWPTLQVWKVLSLLTGSAKVPPPAPMLSQVGILCVM